MSVKSKNTKRKKGKTITLTKFILLAALISAALAGFWLAKRESTSFTKGKIEISGVFVNDFLRETSNSQKTFVTLVKNETYHIFYIPNQKLFTISITASAFDEQRIKAEEEFLSILGIDKQSACKLNVNITTPSFVNPDKGGEIYGLSFCQ